MANDKALKPRQIKAARALLDWSQEHLATASGLSIATIRNIELGHISSRRNTGDLIRFAFEREGLEFLKPDGVRHRPDDVTIYEGREGLVSFFDDVYKTVTTQSTDIVVVCASEQEINDIFGPEYGFAHIRRMTVLKDRISVKCILTENRDCIPASEYCEYRWISKHYVDAVPFYIYGNKYAIMVFDADPARVTVIQSPTVANAFRKQFASMWDKSIPINAQAAAKPKKK